MRRLLVLVSTIIFVDALLFTALTPLVPKYADEFDLSKAGAGLLVGATGQGALLGGSRRPRRCAWGRSEVVGSLLLLAVASFAFAFAGSAPALGFARFVQGSRARRPGPAWLAWISWRLRASAAAR
jgi:predicted MFS family arabinose efflux permease